MYKIKVKIRGCKNIDSLEEFIRIHNIKLVLFGEYHGFFNQIQVQRKIIQNIHPNFFLYELLEEDKILNDKDAKKFLSKSYAKDFSFVSTYGELKPIIRLARSFDLPIIGCDIKNMYCKNKDWRKKKFSHEEAKMIINKRELQQAKIINQYTAKGLVFALLGDYHLRKNSLVFSKLKEKKAIIVKPLFEWEERFNDPKKFNNSEISYIIKATIPY
jgi:hypothetical protein